MPDPLSITDKAKVLALLERNKKGKNRDINEAEMKAALKVRVKGQDHVIDDMVRTIRLNWGKEQRSRPICNLLFLGPTGTGKTELAKAMAEYLYEDEKNMLRFDCPSDLTTPESKPRLVGHPVGYVGSDSGGALTRPMLNNPRRLVLFDEIEKAWPPVFDIFLSMMGEGRLTEQGKGARVADFTQSIIVLTSNAEHEAIGKIQEQVKDPHEMMDAVKKHLRDSNIFRPEIIGRFDKIYVFNPLTLEVNVDIAEAKIIRTAKEFGMEIVQIDPALVAEIVIKSEKLKEFGTRELERIVNETLGEALLAAKAQGIRRVTVSLDADGTVTVAEA